MKKFLVLNQNYQPLNPYQFGFKQFNSDGIQPTPPAQLMLDEEEAKKFGDSMARSMPNQTIYLVEIKSTAKATPPVNWEDFVG